MYISICFVYVEVDTFSYNKIMSKKFAVLIFTQNLAPCLLKQKIGKLAGYKLPRIEKNSVSNVTLLKYVKYVLFTI